MLSETFYTKMLNASSTGIAEASELLRQGHCVAFPTETVYGLGADATNATAVARIFAAKDRPSFNPLIVHVASIEAAWDWVVPTDWARDVAKAFWPGPLTLVLPKKASLPDIVTAGHDLLAIRVPAHPLAQQLLQDVDLPLAAPSANPSGRISPTTAQHVREGLNGRIAAIVDGGPCAVGLESTIVGGPEPRLLRPGGVATDAIEAVLGTALQQVRDQATPTVPGQLSSHYAPNAKVRLNVVRPHSGEVFLGFGPSDCDVNLSPTEDLIEAAANLFAALRQLDATGQPIAVAQIPMQGLGVAINDRLARAAAPRG